jgi:hypothetical protein
MPKKIITYILIEFANLHNNSKGIVQSQDDCVDSELEKLRKKLREL